MWLIIGLVIGSTLGFITAACLSALGNSDKMAKISRLRDEVQRQDNGMVAACNDILKKFGEENFKC